MWKGNGERAEEGRRLGQPGHQHINSKRQLFSSMGGMTESKRMRRIERVHLDLPHLHPDCVVFFHIAQFSISDRHIIFVSQ